MPENGLNLVKDRLHERSDGAFTLVAQTDKPVACHAPPSTGS